MGRLQGEVGVSSDILQKGSKVYIRKGEEKRGEYSIKNIVDQGKDLTKGKGVFFVER